MLCFTVDREHGSYYGIGQTLFRSQTNNVDVTFTSDYKGRRSGFSLDVRSTLCAWPDFCDDPVEEVVVAANETLEGAIVTHTEEDGLYPNNACQDWKIITDENQVYIVFQRKVCILYCMKLIYCNLFQCIVISVGDGGFNTESWYDRVVFKDSESFSGIKFSICMKEGQIKCELK